MASPAVTGLLVLLLAAGLALVVASAVAAGQLLRLRRLAGAGRIRDGLVSVRGTASPADGSAPVTSPLSGRPALCYEYEVRPADRGPRRGGWGEPATGRDGVPFVLATERGRVRVDPAGADLALEPRVDATLEGDDAHGLEGTGGSLAVEASDDALAVGEVGVPAEGRYRVLERRLEPGDAVAVTGVARTEVASDGGDADGAQTDAVAAVADRSDGGLLARVVGVPFVVGDAGVDRPGRQLLDRAIVALVFGLPLALLSLVLLFPEV